LEGGRSRAGDSNILQKDGSQSWTFDIAGIYEYPDEPDMSTLLIVNNEYFDQTRVDLPEGFVARFVVKTATPQQAPDVIDSIDALFANSAAETITASENASAQERLQSMGDLDLLARAVTGAAFSALLLSVGTMLVYSVRQRTPELGVLKAIGFSNRRIVIVIGAEIMLVALTGAGCGLIAAWCVLPLAREYVGLVQMPGVVVILGLGCAVLLALICSWLPVRHALRLRIVEALTRP
jgi:putative ABC transport system permease protein